MRSETADDDVGHARPSSIGMEVRRRPPADDAALALAAALALLASHLAAGSRGEPGPSPRFAAHVVDLNAAPQGEIEALPGVGPRLATRIVAARPFASVEELGRVRGLGASTIERLRPHVRCVASAR